MAGSTSDEPLPGKGVNPQPPPRRVLLLILSLILGIAGVLLLGSRLVDGGGWGFRLVVAGLIVNAVDLVLTLRR